MATPLVRVAKFLRSAVAVPGISDDPRAWLDVIFHESMQ